MEEITIGRLAKATGSKVPTIRYYEQIGLLPEPPRSSGNTRLYGEVHRARLCFIQHCRDLGFPQTAIRELLELSDHPDQSCEAATDIAIARLRDIDRRISKLAALRSELEIMINDCAGGRVDQCGIIGALAEDPRSGSNTDE